MAAKAQVAAEAKERAKEVAKEVAKDPVDKATKKKAKAGKAADKADPPERHYAKRKSKGTPKMNEPGESGRPAALDVPCARSSSPGSFEQQYATIHHDTLEIRSNT